MEPALKPEKQKSCKELYNLTSRHPHPPKSDALSDAGQIILRRTPSFPRTSPQVTEDRCRTRTTKKGKELNKITQMIHSDLQFRKGCIHENCMPVGVVGDGGYHLARLSTT